MLHIAKQNKPTNNCYAIDEIAKLRNINVLRLPPYPCKLNPLEMIWAQIKNYIIKRNVTFEFAKMKILFYKAVNAVTKGNWKNCVEHVNTKVENKF